jgi:hypothetical protein
LTIGYKQAPQPLVTCTFAFSSLTRNFSSRLAPESKQ